MLRNLRYVHTRIISMARQGKMVLKYVKRLQFDSTQSTNQTHDKTKFLHMSNNG